MNTKSISTWCETCSSETNHKILSNTDEMKIESTEDINEYESYNIIQCLGCNTVSFLKLCWDDQIQSDDDVIHYHFPENYYREFEDYFLNEDDLYYLPAIVTQIYAEVCDAYITESSILCGIGLRMIIESVCLNKKIAGRNLENKIDKLFELGYISKNDLSLLHKLREIGNISAHQIKSPANSIIDASLEAINHLLRSIYVVSRKTKRLRKSNNSKKI